MTKIIHQTLSYAFFDPSVFARVQETCEPLFPCLFVRNKHVYGSDLDLGLFFTGALIGRIEEADGLDPIAELFQSHRIRIERRIHINDKAAVLKIPPHPLPGGSACTRQPQAFPAGPRD